MISTLIEIPDYYSIKPFSLTFKALALAIQKKTFKKMKICIAYYQ
jgi:hypothetical protein